MFAAPAATIPFLLFSGFFVTLSAVPWYLQVKKTPFNSPSPLHIP